MIILLDTSTPMCKLTLVASDAQHYDYEWQADRQLAKGLLGYIEARLARHDAEFATIRGIGVYKGPGSFTGLRIGLTVANTLADGLGVPVVGVTGDNWRETALQRLASADTDQIVLPLYGSEAHITAPRK